MELSPGLGPMRPPVGLMLRSSRSSRNSACTKRSLVAANYLMIVARRAERRALGAQQSVVGRKPAHDHQREASGAASSEQHGMLRRLAAEIRIVVVAATQE